MTGRRSEWDRPMPKTVTRGPQGALCAPYDRLSSAPVHDLVDGRLRAGESSAQHNDCPMSCKVADHIAEL